MDSSFSKEKNSFGNWIGGHLCYILAEGLISFCLCPENLFEAKLKVIDKFVWQRIFQYRIVLILWHASCSYPMRDSNS